jgi:hypothetical protein
VSAVDKQPQAHTLPQASQNVIRKYAKMDFNSSFTVSAAHISHAASRDGSKKLLVTNWMIGIRFPEGGGLFHHYVR